MGKNNYDIGFEEPTKENYEYIYNKDREITVQGKDGETYAGEYARQIMDSKKDAFSLGVANVSGDNIPINIDIDATTLKHTALFGSTGGGKTTLMENTMIQLANKGYGFTFIDPKVGTIKDLPDSYPKIGQDAHKLLRALPKHRLKDVVYINPEPIGGYSISMNPIEVPEHLRGSSNLSDREDAIETQQKLLQSLMQSNAQSQDMESFGAQMERAFEGLFQPMIRSKTKYTFADMHVMLNNPSTMELFYDKVKNELNDEFIVDETQKVSNMNEGNLKSIIRRTRRLVTTNRTTRDFIVNQETDINFKDIIEQNKILIVDIQANSDAVLNTCIGYVINSLFTAAKKGKAEKEHILFGDEFHKVVNLKKYLPLDDILSEGRSNNFLLWYATQKPDRVQEFVKNSLTNLGLAITGAIDSNEAGKINSLFIDSQGENISKNEIARTPQFSFYMDKKSSESSYLKLKGFAPYPPRRSWYEAALVAGKSVREYGSEHKLKRTYVDSVNEDLLDNPATLLTEQGLRGIYSASKFDMYNNNELDMGGYATLNTIKKIFKHAYDVDFEKFNIDTWLEQQLNIEYIEAEKIDGDVCYRLTDQGKNQMKVDTGESGSAGGDEHRLWSQELKNSMSKYGMHITLPQQGGSGEMPDAYGVIFEKTDETPFTDEYKIGEKITIEVEKETTASRTSKMLKNFRKADDTVIFVTMRPDIAEKIEKTLSDNGGLGKTHNHGIKVYNTNTSMSKNGTYPLRKLKNPNVSQAHHTRWFIDKDRSKLMMYELGENKERIESVVYDPIESFSDWSIDDFPAYAKKSNGGYIIHDTETGEKHGPYKKRKHLNNTDEYQLIKKPWVPEIELEQLPQRDEYKILVLPYKSDNDFEEPQIYHNGEYYNMVEGVDENPTNEKTNIENNSDDLDDLEFF